MRVKQALVVFAGLALAAVMVGLGIWQYGAYQSSGERSALSRAAAPPLDLRQVAPAGTAVRDGFGRSVTFQGRYLPTQQVLVQLPGQPGRYRVLTRLRQADGSIVPVVRGIVTSPRAPVPRPGLATGTGVLLPSEDNAPSQPAGAGNLDAVRLPVLVQRWSGPLIGGYVTLSAPDARVQGLAPAPVSVPPARGRLRNVAYAFQWWLFAVFTIAMALRIARDLGRQAADDRFHSEVEVTSAT